MFDNVKNMYALQKQAKQIKKDLRNIHIEAEEGSVIVVINGEQEIISVTIKPEFLGDHKKIEKDLVIALNKAIKKSQQIAAEKMKGIMGEMGMPGLPQA